MTAALLALAMAQTPAPAGTGFVTKVFKNADGHESPYTLFVPHGYDGSKAVPVILFLHGYGETKFSNPPKTMPAGVPSKTPVDVGIGPHVKMREKSFPALVIIPRAEDPVWMADNENGKRVMGMLDEVMKGYKVDPARVYLTGLSMGGFGTWNLATAYPEKWAAIVPVCGGLRFPSKKDGPKPPTADEVAAKIKDIPCWCWHGGADGVVKPELSREIVEALKKAGGKPRYTELEEVGHNSWDACYATDDVYNWLFRQKKQSASK